jgi:hypothetical protein
MPRHYTDFEIRAITQDFLLRYPPALLSALRGSFTWGTVELPTAWLTRKQLAAALDAALTTGSLSALLAAADRIFLWGFGQGIPQSVRGDPSFLPALYEALLRFRLTPRGNYRACVPALARLLCIKDLGIASVSKWICLLDQERFAIYDSRVSVALLNVAAPCGSRAFPVVGRRPIKGVLAWQADSQVNNDPWRAARVYVDYLHVLEQVRVLHRRHYAARIEMALFMAGGPMWRPPGARRRPMRRGMWS